MYEKIEIFFNCIIYKIIVEKGKTKAVKYNQHKIFQITHIYTLFMWTLMCYSIFLSILLFSPQYDFLFLSLAIVLKYGLKTNFKKEMVVLV